MQPTKGEGWAPDDNNDDDDSRVKRSQHEMTITEWDS